MVEFNVEPKFRFRKVEPLIDGDEEPFETHLIQIPLGINKLDIVNREGHSHHTEHLLLLNITLNYDSHCFIG